MKKSTWIIIVCFIFILPACRFSWITNLVANSGDVLFMDDFSQPSSDWKNQTSQAGHEGLEEGTFQIKVLLPNTVLISTPGHIFHDTRTEIDAGKLEGPIQNLYGLACRFRNPSNYYFFGISSDGFVALGKMKDGKTSLIGQEKMTFSDTVHLGNETNHLRLDCIGSNLAGSVNGQPVISGSDPDFISGEIGLLAGAFTTAGVAVYFDNLVVYHP